MFSPVATQSPYIENPYGCPFSPAVLNYGGDGQVTTEQSVAPTDLLPPEQTVPRALNFLADYSGCGFWRLIWPQYLLTINQEMVVESFTKMILDPNFFRDNKSIRIQRQATPNQLQYVKALRQICDQLGIHLIYEVDDVIFHEDIPEYNKFRTAFVDPQIRNSSQEIMLLCDEITVTCPFMRDYYADKTGHKNVTVIPNYPPRWWIGNYYNEQNISRNYDKHKKQPRVMYPGSAAHFDVDFRVKSQDDFAHVNEAVIATRKKFKWVFYGAYPFAVKQYIQSGEMEFHPWQLLAEYPRHLNSLNVNAFVAPLQDNTFNRSKSDIKYVEASCFGVPAVCQDLVTYKNCPNRFTTGDEMVALLEKVLKYKEDYMRISRKARLFAETRFLENKENIGKYKELYSFKKGSPERVLLK